MSLSRLIYKILFRSLYQSPLRLQRAKTEKEKALTSKALVEARATQLESFRKNTAAFAFAYGVLVVFIYCFIDLKFFPSGLSTGDVLFFLFAALGLGLLSLACTALGMSAFLLASFFESCMPKTGVPTHRKLLRTLLWFFSPVAPVLVAAAVMWNPWSGICAEIALVAFFVAMCGMGVAVAPAHGRSTGWSDALAHAVAYLVIAPLVSYVLLLLGQPGLLTLGIFWLAGMVGALGLELLDAELMTIPLDPAARKQHATKLMVAKIFFAGSLLPALVIPDLRLLVFTGLGVRTADTAVSLDKANLALLRSAADTAGIPLSVCRGEDDQATVAPIDVLWHASGTRSLVHFGGKQGIDAELTTAGLKLVRGKVERCVEIKESLLFNSGTADLIAGTEAVQAALGKELAPLLKEISQNWQIKSVKVVGHADPMPLPLNGNDALAKKRAVIVKNLLADNAEFSKSTSHASEIEPVSDASRHPIKQCDTKESAAYQRSCNEVNRRVEIRFRLERIPAKT